MGANKFPSVIQQVCKSCWELKLVPSAPTEHHLINYYYNYFPRTPTEFSIFLGTTFSHHWNIIKPSLNWFQLGAIWMRWLHVHMPGAIIHVFWSTSKRALTGLLGSMPRGKLTPGTLSSLTRRQFLWEGWRHNIMVWKSQTLRRQGAA